jgi:hypothetical protein
MEFAHCAPGFRYYPDRLVAEYQRGLAPDIPWHDIAGANAARCNADHDVVGTGFGTGTFFETNIAEIVEPCHPHSHCKTLRSRGGVVN